MKDCEDCVFMKTYINRRKMSELNTDKVIWYLHCENRHTPTEIQNTQIANECEYYNEDEWIK